MKKERNYTIDLFRFIFAFGFIFGHMAILLARIPSVGASQSTFALDTLAVFICISGFFMMRTFEKQNAIAEKEGIHPTAQAGKYLYSRLKGLGPWFLFGNVTGFIGLCLYTKTPVSQWLDAFLNHLGEFFGLMLTGFNFGSNMHGLYGTTTADKMLINGPLWFVSGLFITSYFLYWLLASNKKITLYVVVPFVSLLFYGSSYLNGLTMPLWHNFISIGDFHINVAMVDMFCNLGIGCMMYEAVQYLSRKEFSKGFTVFLTVLQIFLIIFIPFRTLYPTNGKLNIFTFNWGPAYLLSLLFTFLLVLNRDKATQFLNRPFFGKLGALSMYIYCIHYSVIILLYCAAPNLPVVNKRAYMLGVIIITMILSVIAEKVNPAINKWLSSSPWYKKESADK